MILNGVDVSNDDVKMENGKWKMKMGGGVSNKQLAFVHGHGQRSAFRFEVGVGAPSTRLSSPLI